MIGAIENAILARLKAAADANLLGYKYAKLETYPADWDEYLKENVITYPSAWVVCGGGQKQTTGKGSAGLAPIYSVVVAAENRRNEKATRHGQVTDAGVEVGSYQMAEDVIRLLHGSDLGQDIDALEYDGFRFIRLEIAMQQAKASMISVQFTTSFSIETFDAPIGGALDDFETFAAAWDVPPVFDPPVPDLETQLTLPIQEPTP